MDINLLKTFLEVYRTRHFGRAAENLFLTQSAVSARIRLLEETLGVPLFDRKRKDIRLTAAGRRFLKHAERLLYAWNRACQETAQIDDGCEFLAVGAVPGAWEILLGDWLNETTRFKPHLSLLAEIDGADPLLRKLFDGVLDLIFVFEPPQIEEFAVQEVGRIPLVLVATRPGLSCAEALGRGYVMVDWGASFMAQHGRCFAESPVSRLRVGLGGIALAHIQAHGGAAYLAQSLVERSISEGRLFRVRGAPLMERPVFAVYAYLNSRLPLIAEVLAIFGRSLPRLLTSSGP